MAKVRGVGRVKNLMGSIRATETEFRKQLWQRWHNPSGHTTPVFLVGNGRSGTSMLVFHLTRSWQIKLYNEDNPVAFEKWFLRDLSIIEELVGRSYAPVTLFKPIKDTYRIRALQSRFPRAKVLFAFRHYDDVINSSRKQFYIDFPRKIGKAMDDITPPATRWMADDFAEYVAAPPPEETKRFIKSKWSPSLNLESNIALHWLFVNRLFFDLGLDQDERVKLIRYESVVSAPVEEFQDMCHFLGLSYEPRMVEGVFASSIKRRSPPDIDPEIRLECEQLWQRVCQYIGVNDEVPV